MEELKTCHQCRQRTKNQMAICKNLKEGKACTLKFCQRCLLNRYGEIVDEVEQQNDWKCPKCRSICNCSVCMKRKGNEPVGKLARTAKDKGYSSVSDLLSVKPEEYIKPLSAGNEEGSATLEKGIPILPAGEQESASNEVRKEEKKITKKKSKWTSNYKSLKPYLNEGKETTNEGMKEESVKIDPEELKNPILSLDSLLKDILEMKFEVVDIGNVLQFLEFCTTFGEVVGMKKGEAEAILHQLVYKDNLRKGEVYLLTQFQTKLLSVIRSESGNGFPFSSCTYKKNTWLKALVKLISTSEFAMKELELNSFVQGIDKYYELDLSKKLRILNFLCDEALGTEKLRSFIDDQNSKLNEKVKEAKAKYAAAMEKEKILKQKLCAEEAKADVNENEGLLSNSEQETLLSQLRIEAEKAHAEMVEAKNLVPKRNKRCSALRTEPVFSDTSGKRFWKLNGYRNEDEFLVQEVKVEDTIEEKWFVFGAEKEQEIEKYISSRVEKPNKMLDDSCTATDGDNKANM